MERPASGRIFLGVRPANHDRRQIYRGIRVEGGGAGSVIGVESGVVAIFGGHNGRCGGQSPVDRLRGPAEVPPAGVGFCAARHPRYRDGVPAHIGRAAQ